MPEASEHLSQNVFGSPVTWDSASSSEPDWESDVEWPSKLQREIFGSRKGQKFAKIESIAGKIAKALRAIRKLCASLKKLNEAAIDLDSDQDQLEPPDYQALIVDQLHAWKELLQRRKWLQWIQHSKDAIHKLGESARQDAKHLTFRLRLKVTRLQNLAARVVKDLQSVVGPYKCAALKAAAELCQEDLSELTHSTFSQRTPAEMKILFV